MNTATKNTFAIAVNTKVAKSKKNGLTHNGAVTRKTSGQSHLDLFAIAGACRNAKDDVVRLFIKAYANDKALALRIMLWVRDIRGGAGEREAFRSVIRQLVTTDPIVLERLIPYVPEYGRWDDLIESLPLLSPLFASAAKAMHSAIVGGNALAAKWAPRKGAVAVALRDAWKMTPKQYRQFIVSHTHVVETQMCAKDWDAIDFSKLPSLAGLRYQSAFARNATARYEEFKSKLVKGDITINAGVLFPHNIVTNIRRGKGDTTVLNESWKALPNYVNDTGIRNNVIVMSDVSGSMASSIGGESTGLDVSLALGAYTAERLTGPFKDLVLTFSSTPLFVKLTGNTIADRLNSFDYENWEMSTNLQAAFQLILATGVKHNVPTADMPTTVVVISDMEFDACVDNTNYSGIKQQYKAAGYKVPNIVFWNVNARLGNNPVKHDTAGTCMVSGYSPSILTAVLTGNDFDPMSIMMDTVGKERYAVAELVVNV